MIPPNTSHESFPASVTELTDAFELIEKNLGIDPGAQHIPYASRLHMHSGVVIVRVEADQANEDLTGANACRVTVYKPFFSGESNELVTEQVLEIDLTPKGQVRAEFYPERPSPGMTWGVLQTVAMEALFGTTIQIHTGHGPRGNLVSAQDADASMDEKAKRLANDFLDPNITPEGRQHLLELLKSIDEAYVAATNANMAQQAENDAGAPTENQITSAELREFLGVLPVQS